MLTLLQLGLDNFADRLQITQRSTIRSWTIFCPACSTGVKCVANLKIPIPLWKGTLVSNKDFLGGEGTRQECTAETCISLCANLEISHSCDRKCDDESSLAPLCFITLPCCKIPTVTCTRKHSHYKHSRSRAFCCKQQLPAITTFSLTYLLKLNRSLSKTKTGPVLLRIVSGWPAKRQKRAPVTAVPRKLSNTP